LRFQVPEHRSLIDHQNPAIHNIGLMENRATVCTSGFDTLRALKRVACDILVG